MLDKEGVPGMVTLNKSLPFDGNRRGIFPNISFYTLGS
jgi:hypothetical protein